MSSVEVARNVSLERPVAYEARWRKFDGRPGLFLSQLENLKSCSITKICDKELYLLCYGFYCTAKKTEV